MVHDQARGDGDSLVMGWTVTPLPHYVSSGCGRGLVIA